MPRNRKILIAAGAVLLVFLLSYSYIRSTYNQLVTLDEGVKAAWSQVENQLQRRYDLIPNYVNTVKGYAAHERQVLTSVTEARSRVGQARTVPEKIAANNELSSALSRLLVVVENYPTLKADQNFIRLQDELAGTENRIATERRRYNEAVQSYNIKTRSFPENIVASMSGFKRAEFFKAPAAAGEAPKVQF